MRGVVLRIFNRIVSFLDTLKGSLDDFSIVEVFSILFGFILSFVFMALAVILFGWAPILLDALGVKGIIGIFIGWMVVVTILCILA